MQGSLQNRFSIIVCQSIDCDWYFRNPSTSMSTIIAPGEKGRACPPDGLSVLGMGLHFSSAFLYNEVRCLLKIQVSEIFFFHLDWS